METQKKGRGGAREGAGRHCAGEEKRVTLCLRVAPETVRKITEYAEARGFSKGKMLDFLVDAFDGLERG